MGARKNGRAKGRHARREGVPARKTQANRFNAHSVSADILQLIERLPREKVIALGEKTVNQ